MTDWGLLGGDPAPGRPDVIASVASTWSAVANHGEAVTTVLRQTGSGIGAAWWMGEAADATAGRIAKIVPHLDLYVDAYATAASALQRYADTLVGLQAWGVQAAAQANEAGARLAQAHADAAAASRAVGVARGALDTARRANAVGSAKVALATLDPTAQAAALRDVSAAQQAAATASRRLDDASRSLASANASIKTWQAQLDGARRQADKIRDGVRDAARACSATLHAAATHGLHRPNFIRRSWDDFVDTERMGIGGPELNTYLGILDGLSTACFALGMIIPFLAPVTDTVGLGLTIVMTLGRVLQMANGTRKWDFVELGFDALSVVVGGMKLGNVVLRGGGKFVLKKGELVDPGKGAGSGHFQQINSLLKREFTNGPPSWVRSIKPVDTWWTDTHNERWVLSFPGIGAKGVEHLVNILSPIDSASSYKDTADKAVQVYRWAHRHDWSQPSRTVVNDLTIA
jgi:hypothetical protein